MKRHRESLCKTSKLARLRLRLLGWCRLGSGLILEMFHSPARIKEFEYVDPITNETVYLSTGIQYSVLHIGDRVFFFNRLTGRFDGAGRSFQGHIADRLQLFD
jgi:hypothetical protein